MRYLYITIFSAVNVPVYLPRDGMILMRENPFHWPLEGVGPENHVFWPMKWQRAPPPLPIQAFVQNNIEINSDMKSALDRPQLRYIKILPISTCFHLCPLGHISRDKD